jgi:hypothetical protein
VRIPKINSSAYTEILKTIKALVRMSLEYKTLMGFLKGNYDMNQSFFFKGVKKTADQKFSMEIHHTPFVLEDIVATVIKKRMANGESLSSLHICHEIMHLHFDGKVGLVPLDKTSHALIHSENAPEVFIPIQFIDFGDFSSFYTDYKKYIPENVKANYAYLQDLSMRYENIKDVIPNYMKVKNLYYEGFLNISEFEKLLEMIE